MPANSIVSLHYGPYDSCGVVEYKTERLEGLQSELYIITYVRTSASLGN